jgi:hypothetical protein
MMSASSCARSSNRAYLEGGRCGGWAARQGAAGQEAAGSPRRHAGPAPAATPLAVLLQSARAGRRRRARVLAGLCVTPQLQPRQLLPPCSHPLVLLAPVLLQLHRKLLLLLQDALQLRAVGPLQRHVHVVAVAPAQRRGVLLLLARDGEADAPAGGLQPGGRQAQGLHRDGRGRVAAAAQLHLPRPPQRVHQRPRGRLGSGGLADEDGELAIVQRGEPGPRPLPLLLLLVLGRLVVPVGRRLLVRGAAGGRAGDVGARWRGWVWPAGGAGPGRGRPSPDGRAAGVRQRRARRR